MDPVRIYETTIFDRSGGPGFRAVTAPRSSKQERATPAAAALGFRPLRGRSLSSMEVEARAWNLPFLLDGVLGRLLTSSGDLSLSVDPLNPGRRGGRPSEFAEYLAYASIIPIEASPLAGKSLSELVTAAGGASAAVGVYATGDPLLLLSLAAGIIVCAAARGVGDALRIGLRARLLTHLGVEDPNLDEPPDEPK
jgi:hypothetical protein